MHDSSFFNLKHFFKEYYFDKSNEKLIILDIGSQTSDIDKLKRWKEIFPKKSTYLGVDLVDANNVDIVLEDPYVYPFNDNYADIIIANSIFEHSEFFWVLFLELLRVLKQDGILYINAPSNGDFHRGSHVDVYRFYPDAGKALEKWGKDNNYKNLKMLESYTSIQMSKKWNDFVTIYLKDEKFITKYPYRIVEKYDFFTNGKSDKSDKFINYQVLTQDHQELLNKQYLNRLNIFLRKKLKLAYLKIFTKKF